MSKDKQLFQIQNILETLNEATDHFATLVKKKELNQSIYMFSSIVEGGQTIIISLNSLDPIFTKYTAKIEQYLIMIAQELEKGNFIKISEIVQFSFKPQLNRLKDSFIETLGNQKDDKVISIGVFHSWANPRKFYPEKRVNAMVHESIKQNAVLYFFTSDDVDFDNKQIQADTYKNNSWERVTVPFPDVINNIGAGRISRVERKLRRMIPFTSFHVGNKYTLPKRMIKYRKYVDLLVPFKVCTSASIIHNFMEQNHKAVFKYLGSNRGENIYFVTKKGSRYVLLDQKKELIMNKNAFNQFIQQVILREKGSFVIQKYIHTRTKADEPYHFRAHVQKNGEGKWQLTHIYPCIGNKKSNLSNISTEGRIEDFPTFLRNEFGEKQGLKYEKEILKLSIDVAWHLDKLYGLVLDELGIDFAIDDKGKIWMHEANNGPQTAFHEEKRAVNTIAYAKYIAENGVMYTDPKTKSVITKGQFQAHQTDLPITNNNGQPTIGMLVDKQINDSLFIQLANVAKENNIQFYYFTPKDIDYDRGLIRAYFYEHQEWTPMVAEYPDAIIDRLNMRGSNETQVLYEEFEDIPFTNEWPGYSKNRSEVNDIMLSNEDTLRYFSKYQNVTKPRSVFQFLEKYGKVLLKQEKQLDGDAALSIEQIDDNTYRVVDDTKSKNYGQLQLRHHIQDLIEKNAYIVQHDTRLETDGKSFEIHLHLIKDENNEWSFVNQYIQSKTLVDNHVERENVELETYIKMTFGAELIDDIRKKIGNLSIEVASTLDDIEDIPIREVSLIITIDEEKKLKLLEIDPNSPKTLYDEKQYAKSLIVLAQSLAQEHSKEMKV